MDGILPPDEAKEAMSSSKHEATTTHDSRYYKLAFDIAGEEGKEALKRLIIQRSQDAITRTLKTGALDDARAKAMANIHQELNAFACVEPTFKCKDNQTNAIVPIVGLLLLGNLWNRSVWNYPLRLSPNAKSLIKLLCFWV